MIVQSRNRPVVPFQLRYAGSAPPQKVQGKPTIPRKTSSFFCLFFLTLEAWKRPHHGVLATSG